MAILFKLYPRDELNLIKIRTLKNNHIIIIGWDAITQYLLKPPLKFGHGISITTYRKPEFYISILSISYLCEIKRRRVILQCVLSQYPRVRVFKISTIGQSVSFGFSTPYTVVIQHEKRNAYFIFSKAFIN